MQPAVIYYLPSSAKLLLIFCRRNKCFRPLFRSENLSCLCLFSTDKNIQIVNLNYFWILKIWTYNIFAYIMHYRLLHVEFIGLLQKLPHKLIQDFPFSYFKFLLAHRHLLIVFINFLLIKQIWLNWWIVDHHVFILAIFINLNGIKIRLIVSSLKILIYCQLFLNLTLRYVLLVMIFNWLIIG